MKVSTSFKNLLRHFVDLRFKLYSQERVKAEQPNIRVEMSAADIIAECERVGAASSAPISTSVLPDPDYNPRPKRRSELPKLSPDQLLPPTPR